MKGCRALRPKAANARDAPPHLAVFDAIFFHRAATMLAPHMLEAFEFLCAGCRTARATDARDAPPCLAVFDALFLSRAATRLAPAAPRSMTAQGLGNIGNHKQSPSSSLRNSLFALQRSVLTTLVRKTER